MASTIRWSISVALALELGILVRGVPIIAGAADQAADGRGRLRGAPPVIGAGDIERGAANRGIALAARPATGPSRTSPMSSPAMTARKLKNSPYCARRDQPGRGGRHRFSVP